MLVFIEEKLMEIHKYELAKKYIVYRYTRALVRKSNTTDESILGLIKNQNKEISNQGPNSNKDAVLASTQRDYIAGEVSKDLTISFISSLVALLVCITSWFAF